MTLPIRRSFVSLVAVLFFASIIGCARSAPPPEGSAVVPAPAASGGPAAGPVNRARIVTVDMALTVDDVDRASSDLRALVDRLGGWVADARVTGADENRAGSLALRIPAEGVDAFRAGARALGDMTSDSEKVEDVTEQRADVGARLRAARTQEKRVLEMMSGKASTLGEVIEAEKELARVRENVERLEAQERDCRSARRQP